MSDTPMTDAAVIPVMKRLTSMQYIEGGAVEVEFARTFERQRNQLVEALRNIRNHIKLGGSLTYDGPLIAAAEAALTATKGE